MVERYKSDEVKVYEMKLKCLFLALPSTFESLGWQIKIFGND